MCGVARAGTERPTTCVAGRVVLLLLLGCCATAPVSAFSARSRRTVPYRRSRCTWHGRTGRCAANPHRPARCSSFPSRVSRLSDSPFAAVDRRSTSLRESSGTDTVFVQTDPRNRHSFHDAHSRHSDRHNERRNNRQANGSAVADESAPPETWTSTAPSASTATSTSTAAVVSSHTASVAPIASVASVANNTANAADAASKQVPSHSLTETQEIARPTPNGGYTHTSASKAKISAANKGKTPWNKGKARSEETRARIAAGVRARNRERFLQKLKDLGLTEQEYEQRKKEERRKKDAERRARRTAAGGFKPTEETKQKISRILKEKYANGDIRRTPTDPNKVRRGFKHSEETKKKIAETLRKRWANDPKYRQNMVSKAVSHNNKEQTRKRISESLKKKWQNPDFRAKMLAKIATRKTPDNKPTDEHRAKISAAMKKKWQDQEYRKKTLAAITKRQEEMVRLGLVKPKNARSKRKRKPKRTSAAHLAEIRQVLPKQNRPMQRVGAVEPLEVMQQITAVAVKPRKKAKKKVKKVKKIRKKTPNSSLASDDQVGELKPAKVLSAPRSKKTKTKPKPKEPDGSVNRLKEERRDLFDLLYGDEGDDDVDDIGFSSRNKQKFGGSGIFGQLDDENLDEFDPYGLDDY